MVHLKQVNWGTVFYRLRRVTLLEGTAHYADQLLAPTESFDQSFFFTLASLFMQGLDFACHSLCSIVTLILKHNFLWELFS